MEPYLQQIGGLSDEAITTSLMMFGVAGVIGSFLFARFYVGKRRRYWYIRVSLAGVALALALMMPAALGGMGSVLAVFVLWGICGVSFNVAYQSEILRFAPPHAAAVATAIYSGIFNLGIGGGSAVGGAVSTAFGMGSVCFAGALIGAAMFYTQGCSVWDVSKVTVAALLAATLMSGRDRLRVPYSRHASHQAGRVARKQGAHVHVPVLTKKTFR